MIFQSKLCAMLLVSLENFKKKSTITSKYFEIFSMAYILISTMQCQ